MKKPQMKGSPWIQFKIIKLLNFNQLPNFRFILIDKIPTQALSFAFGLSHHQLWMKCRDKRRIWQHRYHTMYSEWMAFLLSELRNEWKMDCVHQWSCSWLMFGQEFVSKPSLAAELWQSTCIFWLFYFSHFYAFLFLLNRTFPLERWLFNLGTRIWNHKDIRMS